MPLPSLSALDDIALVSVCVSGATGVVTVVVHAGSVLPTGQTGLVDTAVLLMLPAVTSGTLLALALTYVPDIVEPKRVAAVLGLVLAGFSVSLRAAGRDVSIG